MVPLCGRLCGWAFWHSKVSNTNMTDGQPHDSIGLHRARAAKIAYGTSFSFEKVTGRPHEHVSIGLLLEKRFTIRPIHGPKWFKLTIIYHGHLWEFLPKHGTAKQGLAVPHSEVVRQLPCCPYWRRRPCIVTCVFKVIMKLNWWLLECCFYRAMLCISAVYAGTRCLSVCLSVCHVRELRQNEQRYILIFFTLW